ncbi:AAA family ATPase [Deinococcus sp. KNUC1210]|nr:AAA family ATPase [Deinococcus sp. KNUC1210]ULH16111.1 AAA family ATPase [Deinococcus sp. KNUC1210]
MRQKLTIITALLPRPPVLIVDEPMVGLDPHAARQVRELFRAHADAGNTVLLTTHSLPLAEAVCDRLVVLDRGRVLGAGSMDDLRSQTGTVKGGVSGDSLERVFFRLLDEERARAEQEPGATPRPRVNGSLLRLKLTGLRNALWRGPKLGFLGLALLGLLLVWAEVWGTTRALHFLGSFGFIGLGVFRRVLETGLLVLSAGVTFSAITTAISTLYLSDDLNFLLAQPIPARQVFGLKVAETFLAAALVPTVLTLPILYALSVYFAAPWWCYPIITLTAVLLYALPVGLGALLAVLLMRVSPVSRVREVATGLGVVISAGLVYGVRALHPEALVARAADPLQLNALLRQLSGEGSLVWPHGWAAAVIWDAAHGHLHWALLPLLALSVVLAVCATLLASYAYQAGWARNLDSSRLRLDPAPRRPGKLEQRLRRFGPGGLLASKDLTVTLRDPTQWSQLLVLAALAAVYLVSIRSLPLPPIPGFRGVLGYFQLAFQGFVLAGVGVRMAFPALSTEGRGYWLLRTAPHRRPDRAGQVSGPASADAAPQPHAGPEQRGAAESGRRDRDRLGAGGPEQRPGSDGAGRGPGRGASRFTADNPAEIGFSPGGLLYIGAGLLCSLVLVGLLARPVLLSITLGFAYPGLSAYGTAWGLGGLAGLLIFTVLGTWGPLAWGAARLDRLE